MVDLNALYLQRGESTLPVPFAIECLRNIIAQLRVDEPTRYEAMVLEETLDQLLSDIVPLEPDLIHTSRFVAFHDGLSELIDEAYKFGTAWVAWVASSGSAQS